MDPISKFGILFVALPNIPLVFITTFCPLSYRPTAMSRPFLCPNWINGCEHDGENTKSFLHHSEHCRRRPSDNQANKLWQELAGYYVEALVGNQAGIPDPRKLLGQRLKQLKAVKFYDKDTKDASGIVDYPYQLDIADWWSRGPPGLYFLTNSLDRALCIAVGKSRRTVILFQLELNSRHSPNDVN